MRCCVSIWKGIRQLKAFDKRRDCRAVVGDETALPEMSQYGDLQLSAVRDSVYAWF